MKNSESLCLFSSFAPILITLLMGENTFASSPSLPLNVTVESRVSALGESAEISMTNTTKLPMLCERLDVSLSVIRAESDLPVGSLDSRFTNIFLYPGQTQTESNLGVNELKRLSVSDRSVRLFKITSSLGACRVANFNDYCEHAPMSDRERNTVNILNHAFGVNECKDWNADSVSKIRLNRSGVQDLRPLAYFHNLQVLRIGGNDITSIEGLQDLRNLEKVCVANTPVASMQELEKPYSDRCE